METTKRKRTREENVGDDNGRDFCIVILLKSFYYEHTQIKHH